MPPASAFSMCVRAISRSFFHVLAGRGELHAQSLAIWLVALLAAGWSVYIAHLAYQLFEL
jgi:hypothetical protein